MVLTLDPITRLFTNARVHLPGVLDAAMKLELYNVLDDFLQRTNFWQEEIDYVTVAGQQEYTLVPTEDGQAIALLNNVNEQGGGVAATMSGLTVVRLATEPSESGQTLTATVSFTVNQTDGDDIPVYPDDLLEKYGQTILHGLVGNVMAQPAKPYSNQQLSVFNIRKYNGGVANAYAEVKHQNIHGGQRWRFPSFAGGSQR
jgi:hypothetical protein